MLYPNTSHQSAELIRTILDLHFPNATIIDVNYGLGTFYNATNRKVIGVDLRPTGNIVADNQFLPFPSNSFDLGICDPPYKRSNDRYTARYGKAPNTVRKMLDQYWQLLPELLRVSRLGIIVKCQDVTDGHRFFPIRTRIINRIQEMTGLEPHDIAYLVRSGIQDNMVQGNRHFMSQGISTFLVYKWKSDTFRPVRF